MWYEAALQKADELADQAAEDAAKAAVHADDAQEELKRHETWESKAAATEAAADAAEKEDNAKIAAEIAQEQQMWAIRSAEIDLGDKYHIKLEEQSADIRNRELWPEEPEKGTLKYDEL